MAEISQISQLFNEYRTGGVGLEVTAEATTDAGLKPRAMDGPCFGRGFVSEYQVSSSWIALRVSSSALPSSSEKE
jgi:hypothetical protein